MKRRDYHKGFNIAVENAVMALKAVRSNKLRSILTIAIIAIGITSIVGILTAVDSIGASLGDAYSRMGAGIISITSEYSRSSDRHRVRNPKEITRVQAERFVENFSRSIDADLGGSSLTTMYSILQYDIAIESEGKKTTPTAHIAAVDAKHLAFHDLAIAVGRDFTDEDITAGKSICIIGHNIGQSLFGSEPSLGDGSFIYIKGRKYRVIGIIEAMGNAGGNENIDDRVIIPYTTALADPVGIETTADFTIGILPSTGTDLEEITEIAVQTIRAVRRLAPYDEDDFEISRSDAVIAELGEVMSTLRIAASIIGIITLLGAAVGLMNIMLVSVKERTREIGTLKAIGASSKRIRNQFLLEAIVIGQLGGGIGIIVGILIGNSVAVIMETAFIIPWLWVGCSILLCTAVSIASGYLPASRAAALDPIDCLRYE